MASVLIIGGGISGLCPQGLQKLGIDFKVFERDTSTDARQQGYRVRIHEGAQSIKNVLSPHVVPLFSQSCACGGGMGGKFDALSLEFMPPPAQFTKMSGPGGGPVPTTLDRRLLRDVLMTDIADKVVFGKAFSHYELDSEGVTAHFVGARASSRRGRWETFARHEAVYSRPRLARYRGPAVLWQDARDAQHRRGPAAARLGDRRDAVPRHAVAPNSLGAVHGESCVGS